MANDILIIPGSASIEFSGSAANNIRLQVEPSGSLTFYGTSGSLFSIVDSFEGALLSVADISGIPILEVFNDDKVVMGTYNANTLVVTGSKVGIGTSDPTATLTVNGNVLATSYTGSFSGSITDAVSASFAQNALTANSATTATTATTTTGNAGTATTLQTARLINGTSFNGSANIIVTASYATLSNVPVGIVSSSAQATGWTVTSASFATNALTANSATTATTTTGNAGTATTLQTARLINGTSFNGSANIIVTASYTTLSNIPVGIVSSSTQATGWTVTSASFATNALTANNATTATTATTTTGNAGTATTLQTARLINGTSFNGSANIIVTASYSTLSNIPVGIISSSAQQVVSSYTNGIDNRVVTSTGTSGINGESNLTFDGSTLTVIGGVNATSFTGSLSGSISSATSASFAQNALTANSATTATTTTGNAGTATTLQTARLINGTSFNGSANIIVTASYATLSNVPVGIVSSSTQASTWTVASASVLTTARRINGTLFNGSANIIVTASYATLSNVPVGILSSSTQFNALSNTSASYAATTIWNGVNNKPVGIVSSSFQLVGNNITYAPNGTGVDNSGDINLQVSNSYVSSLNAVGNTPFGSAWYNLVNIRHRGGFNDGNIYGGQIAIGMTDYTDRMAYRSHVAGTWGPWREVVTANSSSGAVTIVGPLTAASITGSISGSINATGVSTMKTVLEGAVVSASAAGGTVVFHINHQSVLYYTNNSTTSWTLNVRGDGATTLDSIMAVGQSLTIAFLSTQGSNAYYQTNFQIDGSARTVKWIGGTAVSGGSQNAIDVYTYTIIKTAANTFTVLGQQTKFA